MRLVKVCGLTREEDVESVAEAGADLAGFVFAPSPRRVSPRRAAELKRVLDGTSVRAVGVFREEEPGRIRRIAEEAGLDLVQLHGEAPAENAGALGVPAIRALRVSGNRLVGLADDPIAAYFLLDTFDPDRAGGTGRPFDWGAVRALPLPRPFLLAGGLRPENVGEAIAALRPDGVDVSSGVEEAPGVKSAVEVRRFVLAARAAWEKIGR
ncbi:MAG: phosphoribosylanthranilate isomerase [Candidatus Eisenbacteria bacterium]